MADVRDSAAWAIHVGVNAHLLSLSDSYRSAGINWYAQNLLNHLPEVDPDVRYTVFLAERRYAGVPGLHLQISHLPTHRPPVRIFWEQVVLPWLVQGAGVDLVHGVAFAGPLASAGPFIVTVHDLSFLFYPGGFKALNRLYLRIFTRLSVRRARRVIAVSESTKRDLVQRYHVPPAKVDVVHNGVDAAFRPLPDDAVAAFRNAHQLPERFILFVGTLEPRKNVVRLVEAYARLPKPRPPLMLVGGKGWLYEELFARVEALNLVDEVRPVGYVSAEDLTLWYNAAEIFVYPSLYEGFGLPPLEAMACGTPVIASMTSSLPEVVGQAGLLVDPADTDGLAGAMNHLLADKARRQAMRRAGLAQAKGFTWQETARHTVRCYRRALATGGGERYV